MKSGVIDGKLSWFAQQERKMKIALSLYRSVPERNGNDSTSHDDMPIQCDVCRMPTELTHTHTQSEYNKSCPMKF